MASSCYIHIPFCHSICSYCDFYKIKHDPVMEKQFIDALCNEMKLRQKDSSSKTTLRTLYFGGGTPSILSLKSWEKIFNTLSSCFSFAEEAEITIEANPESITSEKLNLLYQLGVNRLSIGIQSFQNENLKVLGRAHDVSIAQKAVELGRENGFENISIDLIYSLPNETNESILADLEKAVELKPEHISFYALTLEGDVPLQHQVEKGELHLPDADILAERYLKAVEYLKSNGYIQYEVSNFALENLQCQHNLTYWQGKDYYSFGPAAVSTLNSKRINNNADIDSYITELNNDNLPPHETENIDNGKKLLETIFLSLRLTSGLDIQDLLETKGYDILKKRRKLLEKLGKSGDLNVENNKIKLTIQGMFRSDGIAVALCPDFI